MQSTQHFVHVEPLRSTHIERGLYSDHMASLPVDVPKIVHDIVSFLYHKRLERQNFWNEVKTLVQSAMTLDESDPYLALARMLFGGILVHNIKIASQGKHSGRIGDPAFVSNIINEPGLTIEKLMKAIDGTDHRAHRKSRSEAGGGRKSGIGASGSGYLGASSSGLGDSSSGLGVAIPVTGGGHINKEGGVRSQLKDFIRGDNKHVKHFFEKNVPYLAHLRSLSGSDLREQFPKDDPDAHLYYCFLVWLRAFADDLRSICFISRPKSREAIDEYLSLWNNHKNYLDAPFATDDQACQIAIGISEMMRHWSTTTLDQWRRIVAPATIRHAELDKRFQEHEIKYDKLSRSLEEMTQLRMDDATQSSNNLARAMKTIDNQSKRLIQSQADRDALVKTHKEYCDALEKKRKEDCDALKKLKEDCDALEKKRKEDCDALKKLKEDCDALEKRHKEDCDALEKRKEDCDALEKRKEDCDALEKKRKDDCDALEKRHKEDCDALEKRHKDDCDALERKRSDDRKHFIVILVLLFAIAVGWVVVI